MSLNIVYVHIHYKRYIYMSRFIIKDVLFKTCGIYIDKNLSRYIDRSWYNAR